MNKNVFYAQINVTQLKRKMLSVFLIQLWWFSVVERHHGRKLKGERRFEKVFETLS